MISVFCQIQIRSRCLKKVHSHQSHFDTAKTFAFCQACLYFVKSWQTAGFQTEKEIDKKQKERSVSHEEGRLKEPRKLNERYIQKSKPLGRLDFSWRLKIFNCMAPTSRKGGKKKVLYDMEESGVLSHPDVGTSF